MDISRGLGVLLIVIVHAGSVHGAMSGAPVPHWVRTVDMALEPFRIPLLIFLSGMLLTRSLAKGSERFVAGKLKNLVWPYLIWTAVILVAGSGFPGLLSIKGWLGATVLWYLTFLMAFYAIGLLFARVPVLVIAVNALALSMVLPDDTRYGSRLFLLMAYFFIGAFAGQHLDRFTNAIRSKWILGLLPLLAAMLYFGPVVGGFKYSPDVAPLVIAATVAMCGVFNLFVSGSVAAAFQFVGRNSLVFYVMHVPIYVVLYRTLFDWDVRSPYAGIAAALVLGILVPASFALLRERNTAVNLLFESPDFRFGPTLKRLSARLDRMFLPHRAALPAAAPITAAAIGAIPFEQTSYPGNSAQP
jgi:fucose 4-O-acetylase-like acetyltransferase